MKLYYLHDLHSHYASWYATKKEALAAFKAAEVPKTEQFTLYSVEVEPGRHGITALLNQYGVNQDEPLDAEWDCPVNVDQSRRWIIEEQLNEKSG